MQFDRLKRMDYKIYMLLMYCVKTDNETEKDHCFLFNELTVF